MFPHRHDSGKPVQPLSDEQARTQVVDAAKQITSLVTLPEMYGGFAFRSCNDQAEAPYRGLVEISFTLPLDERKGYPAAVDADEYFDRIAATMLAHGWNDGPPPGWHPYGRVINKQRVMAIMTVGPNVGWAKIQIYGECANMTDHRTDGKIRWETITDQLRS